MQPLKGNEIFNIMLTPQFYTLKREELPVQYQYQAKRLAPSVMENLLSEGKTYEYYVFKEEDEWVFIAYNPEEISEFLQSKGIGVEQVSKLFFAQQAAEMFFNPVLLNDNEALVAEQGTVVMVPKVLMQEETGYQRFDETFAPKNGVSFGAGISSVIGRKETWMLSSIFVLFALMFFAEGLRYKQVVADMQETVVALLADHPALQSQYARENIAKKYHKIDQDERHKREILKDLSHLVLPGVAVESLMMDNKHFLTELKCPDEKTVARVKALAEGKQYKVSRSGGENVVKVEGTL
jgi:hypothetical protein